MQRRPLSALELSFRKGLWVPVLMLVVAIALFGAARQMAIEARLLAEEGVDTVAQVTGKERRRHTDSDGNVSYSYHLRYTFTTIAGESIRGTQSVSRRLHDSVGIGSRIPVRYVPSRPGLNRVEAEQTLPARLAMNIGSSLLLLGAGFVFWYLLGETRAMLRAVRHGHSGRAQVIAWKELQGKHSKSGKKPWQMMEWRDHANNHRGKTWPKKPALAQAFPPGSEITVWYDPRGDRGFWEWEIWYWRPEARSGQDAGGVDVAARGGEGARGAGAVDADAPQGGIGAPDGTPTTGASTPPPAPDGR